MIAIIRKSKEFPDGIPECGTDAVRFTLLNYMIQSSINLDVSLLWYFHVNALTMFHLGWKLNGGVSQDSLRIHTK